MLQVLFLLLIVNSSVDFAQAQLKPNAYEFFECEKISNNLLKEKVKNFYTELKKDSDSQGYIINYGTDKEIAKREKQIKDSMNFRDDDAPRITFVRGGNESKLKTVFWIVPAGAEPPTP